MKYLNKFIFFAFSLLFIIPLSADATSGACSYYGGVNCNSISSYGKVVCNDGWVNSSVNFTDAEECKFNSCSSFLVDDLPLICREESDYQRKLDYVNEIRANCSFRKSMGNLISDDCSTLNQIELDSCRSGINLSEIAEENYQSCLDKIIKDRFESSLSEDDKLLLDVGQDVYVQIKMNEYCEEKRGIGSKFDIDKEVCTEASIEKMIRINILFSKEFYRTLDEMPEYKEIADYSVIKSLTLDPANRKKTFAQIIKERYPDVVKSSSNVKSAIPIIIEISEGALIKTANNNDIYIVKYVGSKKFKRLILNPSIFNNYGHLKWEDVMNVGQSTLNSFKTSELVRAVGDDKIYRLYPQGDFGQKRLIKNNSVLKKLGFDADSIYEINSFDRESYITGIILE